MMNSQEIFEIALSLDQLWFTKDIKLDSCGLQLDNYLDFAEGHKFLADDVELLYCSRYCRSEVATFNPKNSFEID